MQPTGERNPGADSPSPQAGWVRRLRPAGITLALLYIFSRFIPSSSYQDYPIFDAIDNSWSMAFHEAFLRHFQFGTEFVFTYGPWGFLARGYHPQTYLVAVLAWAGLTTIFLFSGYRLARKWGCNPFSTWVWLVVLAGLATAPLGNDIDTRLLLFAAVLLLLHFPGEGDRWAEATLVVALGCLSLVKFTGLVESGVVLSLISVYDAIRYRRPPWLGLIWAASLLGFWLLAGQSVGGIGPYLKHSFQIAAGYAGAMQMPGKTGAWGLMGFLALAAGLTCLAARCLWGKLHGWLAFPLAGLMALMLIVFKLGYIRQDAHELNAAMALLMLTVLLSPVAWRERKRVKMVVMLLLIGAGTFASAVCHFWLPDDELASQLAGTFQPTRLLSPFLATATGHLNSDFKKIAATTLDVSKSESAAYPETDLYSYSQFELFAQPVKYHPRPIPQSYSAYTPELAEMNADWLRSDRAAADLFFAVQPLDDRFPSLDDGLSWPEIWTRYEPSTLEMTYNPYLLLHRLREPRSYLWTPLTNVVARLGDTVTVPKSDQALIWAELDVRQSLAGKMVAAVYKPPVVFMIVTFPDDSSYRYRLVPGIARAGFLLSPVMSDSRDFASVYQKSWQTELARRKVVSIKVEPEGGSHAYEPEFNVRFSRLEISGR